MTKQPSGWKTIRQAALDLGVSELTIRRRIKDGRVVHRLEGGKYFVNFDLPATAAEPPKVVPSADVLIVEPDQGTSMHEQAISLLPELTRLAQEAGRAQQLEEQLRELRDREARLQTEVVALATRNGWLESQIEVREKEVKLLEDTQKKRGWRRIFG